MSSSCDDELEVVSYEIDQGLSQNIDDLEEIEMDVPVQLRARIEHAVRRAQSSQALLQQRWASPFKPAQRRHSVNRKPKMDCD